MRYKNGFLRTSREAKRLRRRQLDVRKRLSRAAEEDVKTGDKVMKVEDVFEIKVVDKS